MDHQYGIAVQNKFALFFDEDDDPLEILSRQEEQAKGKKKDEVDKKSKSKVKKAVPEVKPKAPEQPPVKRDDKAAAPRSDRGRGGPRTREPREIRDNDGDRRPPRRQGPRDNRDGRAGDENVPPEFRERPDGFKRRDDREGFGGDRGRGRGGRGRGRGRGGERGGFGGPPRGGGFGGDKKREFDRHSGTDRTGIKPTEKREGGGAHNWGSFKDDLEEQPQNESAEWANQAEPGTENVENTEAVPGEQAPEEDPQPQEMTLDEWKALQTQSKPKPQFNIRQAGEGEDGSRWSKGREYHKKHDESDEEEEEEDSDEEEDHHHGRNKNLVTDIRITFNDNPRRGRGRRGGPGGMERGAPRGSRGGVRGFGGSGGRPRESSAPQFDNEADFPSLVKQSA